MDAQGLHNIYVHEAMLIQAYTQCCDWVCVVSVGNNLQRSSSSTSPFLVHILVSPTEVILRVLIYL